jgi:hypothetical protein
MDIILFLLAFAAIIQIAVGLIILFTKRKQLIGILHALHLLSLGLWATGMIFYRYLPEAELENIIFWTKFLYCFGILSAVSFFIFSFHFTKRKIKKWFLSSLGMIYMLFLAFLIFGTNTIITGIEFHPNNREVLQGNLYSIFFVTLLISYFSSFYFLLKQFLTTEGVLKTQTKLILIATVPVVSAASIVNMILPTFCGNFAYSWAAPVLLPTSAFTIYYAIYRHRFLNLNLAFAKLLKKATSISVAAMIIFFVYKWTRNHFSSSTNYFLYLSVFSGIFTIFVYSKVIHFLTPRFTTKVEYFIQAVNSLREEKNIYKNLAQFQKNIQEVFCKKLKLKSANIMIIDQKVKNNYPKLIKCLEKNDEILVTDEIRFRRAEGEEHPYLEELESLSEICLPLYFPAKKLIGVFTLGKKINEKGMEDDYSREEIEAIIQVQSYLSLTLAGILQDNES